MKVKPSWLIILTGKLIILDKLFGLTKYCNNETIARLLLIPAYYRTENSVKIIWFTYSLNIINYKIDCPKRQQNKSWHVYFFTKSRTAI